MRISDWSSDVCSSDLGGIPRDHSAPAAMKGGRIRVLLAEDSATASELLTAILEKEPGIEVVGCAVDGEEAVRMTRLLRPPLVLMDVQMPKMNGFHATKTIMTECPPPIIIVSDRGDAVTRQVPMQALPIAAMSSPPKPI